MPGSDGLFESWSAADTGPNAGFTIRNIRGICIGRYKRNKREPDRFNERRVSKIYSGDERADSVPLYLAPLTNMSARLDAYVLTNAETEACDKALRDIGNGFYFT